MMLSVVLPTHNPNPGRMQRTLAALRAQTLQAAQWEIVLVDNASKPAVAFADYFANAPTNTRIIFEPQPGLTSARRRGFSETWGELIVLVDDDNVLAPDYLAQALQLAAAHPRVGAFGGRSVPEFETPPPAWAHEFFDLLALRDLGPASIVAPAESPPRRYPLCAPIGAGMVLRREAAQTWLAAPDSGLTDRRGNCLSSGGDNDIVLALYAAGWDVAYFPELQLTHLIPATRLDPDYLARLNRGIAQSWVQVLTKHGACPWGPIPRWTVPIRQLRAWLTSRAWTGPAAYIRWQGACGHFEGRVA